jgi:hypothetical protein
MTDEPPAPTLPPLPEHFQFPAQLLEQWVDLPPGERLNLTLTRQDMDNLLFGLLKGSDAQVTLSQALVAWSNGQLAAANESLTTFRRLNIDSVNYFRQFATGVMVSALRNRTDAK